MLLCERPGTARPSTQLCNRRSLRHRLFDERFAVQLCAANGRLPQQRPRTQSRGRPQARALELAGGLAASSLDSFQTEQRAILGSAVYLVKSFGLGGASYLLYWASF